MMRLANTLHKDEVCFSTLRLTVGTAQNVGICKINRINVCSETFLSCFLLGLKRRQGLADENL